MQSNKKLEKCKSTVRSYKENSVALKLVGDSNRHINCVSNASFNDQNKFKTPKKCNMIERKAYSNLQNLSRLNCLTSITNTLTHKE